MGFIEIAAMVMVVVTIGVYVVTRRFTSPGTAMVAALTTLLIMVLGLIVLIGAMMDSMEGVDPIRAPLWSIAAAGIVTLSATGGVYVLVRRRTGASGAVFAAVAALLTVGLSSILVLSDVG